MLSVMTTLAVPRARGRWSAVAHLLVLVAILAAYAPGLSYCCAVEAPCCLEQGSARAAAPAVDAPASSCCQRLSQGARAPLADRSLPHVPVAATPADATIAAPALLASGSPAPALIVGPSGTPPDPGPARAPPRA